MKRIEFDRFQDWLKKSKEDPRWRKLGTILGILWHILLVLTVALLALFISGNTLAAIGIALGYYFFYKPISKFATIVPGFIFLTIFVKKPDACTATGH